MGLFDCCGWNLQVTSFIKIKPKYNNNDEKVGIGLSQGTLFQKLEVEVTFLLLGADPAKQLEKRLFSITLKGILVYRL